MKVAAFTGGANTPPARFRVHQYLPYFSQHGLNVTEFSAALGSWPPRNRLIRPIWFPATLAQRIPGVFSSRFSDLTLLQRSFVSTYSTLEGWTGRPRVFDVDDAIWVHPRGNFARRIVEKCDSVICGNTFLAEYFGRHCKSIVIIPTAVDTNRFVPNPEMQKGPKRVLGWSGSSVNLIDLYQIEDALRAFLNSHPDWEFLVTSDQAPNFQSLPKGQVRYEKWSAANEVQTIQSMDIGIMPLRDSEMTRGKCSYKMLLYMACGIPCIVSPVGMNKEVLGLGNIGMSASSIADWSESLSALGSSESLRHKMGVEGRSIVETHFAIEVVGSSIVSHLRSYKS